MRLPTKRLSLLAMAGFMLAIVFTTLTPSQAHALGNFSLQVSPSPLVATLKPGTATTLELKIKNTSTEVEHLTIVPRGFTYDSKTGKITLNDSAPSDLSAWITIDKPTFVAPPGEWVAENITINLPKDTGFSYAIALVISRQVDPKFPSGQSVKGSVGVFTLIDVDRPGATRKLEIKDMKSDNSTYEYLPASIGVTLKNTGNSIIQPFGNVYIQHGSNDTTPIDSLTLNDIHGYILPGTERTFDVNWRNGFPVYNTFDAPDGTKKTDLVWDWTKLSNFRFGNYTAKLVVVYDDGHHDVPLERTISFWVIPWRILTGALVVCVILGFGIWAIIRKFIAVAKRTGQRMNKKVASKHE